jgi:hypothetical protein
MMSNLPQHPSPEERPIVPLDAGDGAARILASAFVLLGVAFLYGPTRGHMDDTDAQLYQTVARHMVHDGTWFDLRYLPHVHSQFREHLPFGLWPYALWIRLFGEASLPLAGGLFTFCTLLVTWRTAAALVGEACAAVSVLLLATNDSYMLFAGARPRLDAPLTLVASAAAAAVMIRPLTASTWLKAGTLMALGELVKGPFGALPFAAAVVARAVVDRSWRVASVGLGIGAAATAPLAFFLLHDHLAGGGSWWSGYVQGQLLASAIGTRTDGWQSPWTQLRDLGGRFQPVLQLLAFGILQEVYGLLRRRPVHRGRRLAVLTAGVAVIALMLPQRKLPNHAFVAYPLLAVAAGAAVEPWVRRFLLWPSGRRWAVRVLVPAAVILSVLEITWIAPRLNHPCPFSGPLRAALSAPPETAVLLVSEPTNWRVMAELSAELALDSNPLKSLPPGLPVPDDARLAVVQESLLPAELGVWREASRAAGWVVLKR